MVDNANSKTFGESWERLASCPVCRSEQFRSLKVPDVKIGGSFFASTMHLFGLVKCRACGLEFVNPRPSASALTRFYAAEGYVAHESKPSEENRLVNESRLQMVTSLCPGRTLLDYGSGSGSFAELATGKGWIAVGVEVSPVGRSGAESRGLKTYEGVENLPADLRRFDVITMFHVMEHVPDLGGTLKRISTVMAEDSLLVLEVPNICSLRAGVVNLSKRLHPDDERYRAFPIHLYGFSLVNFKRVLADNHYVVTHVRTVGLGLRLPSIQRRPAAASAAGRSITSSGVRPGRRFFKDLILGFVYSLHKGENLLIACRREKTSL